MDLGCQAASLEAQLLEGAASGVATPGLRGSPPRTAQSRRTDQLTAGLPVGPRARSAPRRLCLGCRTASEQVLFFFPQKASELKPKHYSPNSSPADINFLSLL